MDRIQSKITRYFVNGDYNCAASTLLILSEEFDLPLSPQVIDAATGMNGAGKFQAQCGLVEGTLMFLGILGKNKELTTDEIVKSCYNYSIEFTGKFGSITCKELRPEGFKPGNPPNLCEKLAVKTVNFGIDFIRKHHFV